MPVSPGGSVVDPSLLRQANDRGVTIAFADLDGADGLWVPEERTVLVSRKLTEAEVARVIEHELTHVMIDDQHADLDAGKDVLVGHPPTRGRRWGITALAAAALAAVLGGVTYGLAKAGGAPPHEQVAPTVPGLTASESGSAPPGMVVVPSRGPDGRIVYVTVTAPAPSAPRPSVTPTPVGSVTLSPSPKVVPVPGRPSTTVPPPAGGGGKVTVAPTTPPVVTTNPPVTVDPTTVPPTTPEVPPTTPAGASQPPGAGGASNAGGGSTDSAGQPGAAGASDVLVAGGGDVTPVVDPTG